MKVGYGVTHWSYPRLSEILALLPMEDTVILHCKEDNGNLAASWNRGIKKIFDHGYDVAVIMNDDVVVRPDTGELLGWALLEGQYQPLQHATDWPEDRPELLLISARHAALSDARTDHADYEALNSAQPKWQPGPDFGCFAVTPKLFEKVGEFDTVFGVYHEDNDMHRRIQLAGYEAGAFAPYWHYLNGTIRSDPERQMAVHALFQHSRNEFIRKWGGYLGQERWTVPYNGVPQ